MTTVSLLDNHSSILSSSVFFTMSASDLISLIPVDVVNFMCTPTVRTAVVRTAVMRTAVMRAAGRAEWFAKDVEPFATFNHAF